VELLELGYEVLVAEKVPFTVADPPEESCSTLLVKVWFFFDNAGEGVPRQRTSMALKVALAVVASLMGEEAPPSFLQEEIRMRQMRLVIRCFILVFGVKLGKGRCGDNRMKVTMKTKNPRVRRGNCWVG